MKIDPRYFRPTEVETLLGDCSKARTQLGWRPEVSFEVAGARRWWKPIWTSRKRDSLMQQHGFKVFTTMNDDARVFVAGHRGLVGSAIVRELRRAGLREPGASAAARSSTCASRMRSMRSSSRSVRSTSSWRRPRSAASTPTTPTRRTSCATTCRSRPTSSTRPGAPACRSSASSARAASIPSSRRSRCARMPC